VLLKSQHSIGQINTIYASVLASRHWHLLLQTIQLSSFDDDNHVTPVWIFHSTCPALVDVLEMPLSLPQKETLPFAE